MIIDIGEILLAIAYAFKSTIYAQCIMAAGIHALKFIHHLAQDGRFD